MAAETVGNEWRSRPQRSGGPAPEQGGGRVAPGRAGPSRERRPPRLTGPNRQRRRVPRRPQQPCQDGIAPSGQRDRQGKNSHPERRRRSLKSLRRRQAGACRLAWPALAPVAAEVRVRAGPFPKRRARRSEAEGRAGPSASPAPLRFPGRCGVSPLEGVAGAVRRLRLRGRLSPAPYAWASCDAPAALAPRHHVHRAAETVKCFAHAQPYLLAGNAEFAANRGIIPSV